jgi:ankyrin repeat protein
MLLRFSLILVLTVTVSACTSERYTELMNASRDGNVGAIDRALERGLPVNQQSSQGKTALMFAASNGNVDAVSLLLEKGADLKLADQYGTTAIIIAATAGRTEVVKLLLQKGGDPLTKDSSGGSAIDNSTFYGHTDTVNTILATKPKLKPEHATELLMIAAGLCKDKIVTALLKFGVDPNTAGKKQRTALIAATAFNKPLCVQILLVHGAKKSLQDLDGETALDIAKDKGYPELVTLLEKPES